MNKLKNKKTVLAVTFLCAALWMIMVLLVINNENDIGWINFGFGVFSYIVFGSMIIWSDSYIKRNVAVEVYGSTIYCGLLYAGLSNAFNAVCVFVDCQAWKFIVLINVLLLVATVIIVLFSVKYAFGISEKTESMVDSINRNRDIKKEIHSILLICEDDMLKKELKILKELVEYSDRMGKQSSEEFEEIFLVKLDELKDLVTMKSNREEVLSLIKDATNIWKKRNANI